MELTLREFIAYMFYNLENKDAEMLPLWLCLRKDLQAKSLKKVDRLFKEWKLREQEALDGRERANNRVQADGAWRCACGVEVPAHYPNCFRCGALPPRR